MSWTCSGSAGRETGCGPSCARSTIQLATTREERRRLELQILDITYEARRKALEAVKKGDPGYGAAQAELAGLDAAKTGDRKLIERDHESPLERYRRELVGYGDSLNDELEKVAVSGLERLNEGLVDVIMNTKSLGEMFKEVAKQIIADLLRIAVQQAVTLDNRLSRSAGWSGWGTQLADGAMRATTAGCTHDYAEPTETDHYRIYFWTGNASAFGGDYGRVAISVNGGAAIKTVNCSGVAGMSYADVGPADGVTHGVNTYRITTLDAKPVGVAGAIAWSSVNPHLIVVNGGTPLRTMVTMATDAITAFTPENSVPELLRKMGASLIIPEGVTNDAAGLVGDSVYRTVVGSVLDAAIAVGADVWPWTNPPTATATIAQDVQDRYTRIFLAECAKRNLTVADWHFAMGPHAPYAIAKMGIFYDLVHLTGTGTVPGYEFQARRAAEVTGAELITN